MIVKKYQSLLMDWRCAHCTHTAVIEQCRYFFRIKSPSVQLQRRFEKLLANAATDNNVFDT